MSFEDACAAVCGPGTMFELDEAEVLGVQGKVFKACPPNVQALFALAAAREGDFIIYEDERWTMPDVLAQAAQIGDVLVNRYNVKPGDRVAIAMRNYPEWITSFAAIVQIGAVAVPLNAWWKSDEMAFALNDSGASVVMIDEERLERLHGAGEEVQITPIVVRAEGAASSESSVSADRLEDVMVEGASLPVVEIAPDDNMMIMYTSGTTGFPKGAVSTHRAVLSALFSFAARAAVGALMDGVEPDPDEQKSFVLCVPLFHVTGLVPVMLGSFVGGANLVMMHKWDPDRALELIEREQVTNFVGVPTMSWDLLEAKTFSERDTSSLQSVGGGGAPMPPELVQRIEDNFSQGRPGLGYGMTETNAYGPQNSGDAYVQNPTSTGRTIPSMSVRVTDPDGKVLDTGETGEIWFKGPMLIKEYWNRPEATAETIVDGWLRSGDLGSIDDEGYVYVSDRAKDMVLRAGENVYCAEVESAIYEHPAIYEAAVYGIPHERLGEEVAAHIMVKADMELTAEELQTFLGQRVANFKVPSKITFVTDQLPRNAAGKILKRDLRDQFSAS